MKTLSEAEAWREIARRNHERRGFRAFRVAPQLIYDDGLIQWNVRDTMESRAIDFAPPGTIMPNERRSTRVLASLFLALEAEDEAQ